MPCEDIIMCTQVNYVRRSYFNSCKSYLSPAGVIYLVCTSNLYFADKIWKKKKKTPYFPRPCYFYFYKPDPTWSFKSKSRVTALILNHNTITFVIMFCTLFSVFFSLTEFHSWGNFSNIWLKERRLVGENLLWCL